MSLFPPYLKKRVVSGAEQLQRVLEKWKVETVCLSARCPNRSECFASDRVTFIILGSHCTRRCRFCGVNKGTPAAPDPEEPSRIARAVEELGCRYVIITSVTRDDLQWGGAQYFVHCVEQLRRSDPHIRIELLVPDFAGEKQAIEMLVRSRPFVLGHNIETVPRLYTEFRPQADYEQSLWLLRQVKEIEPTIITKSGLMVGLGEMEEEVVKVMRDLRAVECDLLTIGQYLAPTKNHPRPLRYVTPKEFAGYAKKARQLGFRGVSASPFTRSSSFTLP